MKNLLVSSVCGVAALAAGTLCHRVAPGLGLVLMPMFWPLAYLATKVPARYAVATASLVPFVAFLLTGMPAVPVMVAVKFALFTGAVSLLTRKAFLRK